MGGAHLSGETMAALRTRLDPSALDLKADLAFTDIWADTTQPGVAARARSPSATPATPTRPTTWRPPCRPTASSTTRSTSRRCGRAPAASRRQTCTDCHADPAKLDLRADIAGTGRVVVVRGTAARRPGDRRGHRPAGDPPRGRRADDRARPGPGRDRRRRRRRHGALEPADRDPVRRDAEGRRRGAHRAPEPAGRPRRTTRRCSTPPRGASSPNGWTSAASTSTTRSTAACAPVMTLSQATFTAQVLPGAAGELRGRLPPGRRHRADAGGAARSAATASSSPAAPRATST